MHWNEGGHKIVCISMTAVESDAPFNRNHQSMNDTTSTTKGKDGGDFKFLLAIMVVAVILFYRICFAL
jgi:hypothetical protein